MLEEVSKNEGDANGSLDFRQQRILVTQKVKLNGLCLRSETNCDRRCVTVGHEVTVAGTQIEETFSNDSLAQAPDLVFGNDQALLSWGWPPLNSENG